jgi:hypothetical protein
MLLSIWYVFLVAIYLVATVEDISRWLLLLILNSLTTYESFSKKALQSLVTGFVAVPSLSQANTNAELSRFKEEFSEAWKSSKNTR